MDIEKNYQLKQQQEQLRVQFQIYYLAAGQILLACSVLVPNIVSLAAGGYMDAPAAIAISSVALMFSILLLLTAIKGNVMHPAQRNRSWRIFEC